MTSPALINAEVEAALIGAILVNNQSFHQVCRDLRVAHFGEPLFGRIYEVCGTMIDAGHQASPLTLAQFFATDPALEAVGGSKYLYDLAASVITVVNAPSYADAIIDLAQRREMIMRCQDAIAELEDPDVDYRAAEIGSHLITGCTATISHGGGREMSRREVLYQVAAELKEPINATSTGLAGLDRVTMGGFHAGRAYLYAGRPKMGKSALLGTISHNMNTAEVPHVVFCLEMGAVQFEHRSIARDLKFNPAAFYDPAMRGNPTFVNDVANYAATAPSNMYWLYRPGMAFDELRRELAYHVHRHKIRGFMLDYLQLVGGRSERRTMAEHLDNVAQWVAQAVSEFGIWGVVTAQENQDGNIRGGEAPRMAFDQVSRIRQSAATNERYLPMDESRYTAPVDLGDRDNGGIRMAGNGLYFEDVMKPQDTRQGELAELAGD